MFNKAYTSSRDPLPQFPDPCQDLLGTNPKGDWVGAYRGL
jgi:hypothetical protein